MFFITEFGKVAKVRKIGVAMVKIMIMKNEKPFSLG